MPPEEVHEHVFFGSGGRQHVYGRLSACHGTETHITQGKFTKKTYNSMNKFLEEILERDPCDFGVNVDTEEMASELRCTTNFDGSAASE